MKQTLPLVRPFMLIVILVLTVGSFGLYFFPAWTVERWPWPLPPFHTRFLGAVYLSEFSAVLILLLTNRWAPARLSLPVAVSFTLIVSVASFIHLNTFDFTRRGVWLWFILYVVSLFISAFLLWHYRQPPQDAAPTPALWRAILIGQAILYGGYGLGLFLAPEMFGAFWPWKIDAFHGHLYSSVFLSGALGNLILARVAARIEYLTLGLSQFALGFFAILGLFIVNAQVHKVVWSNPGVYLWLGMFGVLVLIGGALTAQARVK
ncbi:MAG TPA: hypothetical protein PK530_06395 [Anaerolineales bacterium]|nr:hypothetical protein [Anaerolineales bacterium]